MKITIYTFMTAIASFFFVACENFGRSTSNSENDSTLDSLVKVAEPTKEGTYLYQDNSIYVKIIIDSDKWQGMTFMKSGFGLEYDKNNAQYDSGYINESELYDNTGMIRIGSVGNNFVHTSLGGQRLTLRKEE